MRYAIYFLLSITMLENLLRLLIFGPWKNKINGIGIITVAINANIVLAHLYVMALNIWFVNSGNVNPAIFRHRLWPASADEANGP